VRRRIFGISLQTEVSAKGDRGGIGSISDPRSGQRGVGREIPCLMFQPRPTSSAQMLSAGFALNRVPFLPLQKLEPKLVGPSVRRQTHRPYQMVMWLSQWVAFVICLLAIQGPIHG
jgi:hypothetical protein